MWNSNLWISNIEQGISNIEAWNRFALSFYFKNGRMPYFDSNFSISSGKGCFIAFCHSCESRNPGRFRANTGFLLDSIRDLPEWRDAPELFEKLPSSFIIQRSTCPPYKTLAGGYSIFKRFQRPFPPLIWEEPEKSGQLKMIFILNWYLSADGSIIQSKLHKFWNLITSMINFSSFNYKIDSIQ